MEKVLVTGGAGFIGSHLIEHLISSDRFVYVLDNFRTGQESNLRRFREGRFELIRDSISNLAAYPQLHGVRTIYHLAAEVGNINSIEMTHEDAATNILGTIRVCDLAREIGAKVIYSSSSAIYGESAYLPIDEKHPLRPMSPYGLSKLTGESYVHLYGRLHGMAYVCLRYFNAYGEGQLFNPYSNVIPIFVERLLAGEPLIVYGDGGQTRDFVHVSDLAHANVLAAESSVSAGDYNVGTGVRSSLLDLLEILRELQPDFATVFQPERPGEVRDSVANIEVIGRMLNFRAHVPLRDGLTRYYRWSRTSQDG
jgi:UDP-glucose 4-epimerase